MQSIETVLKYKFKTKELVTQALTHKSFSAEHNSSNYNERLEFLGDSVLGLAVADFVYNADKICVEGKLSKLKSRLVSKPFLAQWAKEIDLGSYLFLGQGEETTGGRHRESILADAMEAVIGAIFLDGGFEASKKFIEEYIRKQQLEISTEDYKSILQEAVQKKFKLPPFYEVIQTVGPEHDKTFTVTVKAKKIELGSGKGKNKKEAEQTAARNALKNIEKGIIKLK